MVYKPMYLLENILKFLSKSPTTDFVTTKNCFPPPNVMVFLPQENRAASHVSKQMTYHKSRLWLDFAVRTVSCKNLIQNKIKRGKWCLPKIQCGKLISTMISTLKFDDDCLLPKRAKIAVSTFKKFPTGLA